MDNKLDIAGMNKADILAALYNNAKVQGLGFLQATDGDMDAKEAQGILDSGETYFDYLKGRVMKIDLSPENTNLHTGLYNRDNGEGAAERILENLKKG